MQQQESTKVGKGTILYSTVLKATQDAAHELLTMQFQKIDSEAIAKLESAKFSATLKSGAHYLTQRDIDFLTKVYSDQWSDTYAYMLEKLIEISQL